MPKGKTRKGDRVYLCGKCHQPKKGHICTATPARKPKTKTAKPKPKAKPKAKPKPKPKKAKSKPKTSNAQVPKARAKAKVPKAKAGKVRVYLCSKCNQPKRGHTCLASTTASAPVAAPHRPKHFGQKPPSAGKQVFNESMQSSLQRGLALAIKAVGADAGVWAKGKDKGPAIPMATVALRLYEAAVAALLPLCKGPATVEMRSSVAQYLRRIQVLKTLTTLQVPVALVDGNYAVVTRSQYRNKLKAAGIDVSGQDVGHIIAHANGGADHDHNYTMQGAYYNRSMGNKHDAIMCALEGIAKARLAVAASRTQKGYSGPSAEALVSTGNKCLRDLRTLHSGLDGGYWKMKCRNGDKTKRS